MTQQRKSARPRGALSWIRRFLGDRGGNTSAIMALCLVPLVGALAMGTEVSGWWFMKRNLQNAADTAAIAAATTNSTTASKGCTSDPGHYDCEAIAAAANYGFANGANNVTVTPAYLTSGCPTGVSACYKVTVSQNVPIYLSPVVGYRGDTTIGTNLAKTVTAVAYARQTVDRTYCILSLVAGNGTSVTAAQAKNNMGITAKGNSKTLAVGCNMFSDGSTNCTGAGQHPMADYVDTAYTSDPNCAAKTALSSIPPVSDAQWRALASKIPSFTTTSCSAAGVSGDTITTTSLVLPATCEFVGNVTLPANTTVTVKTPTGGSVIFIKDGGLLMNGSTLQTLANSGLTLVFTGSGTAVVGTGKNATPVSYFPTNNGTLDIAAPTSGTWSGVAIYQDPSMPTGSGVDISSAGNQPTWDITGLIYVPNSQVTLKGSVSKSTNGYQCIIIIDQTFFLNGAVSIYDNPLAQCAQAGLTPPTSTVAGTPLALVQ